MLNRYTLPLISALVVSASLASCQRKAEEVTTPAEEIVFTVVSPSQTKSSAAETSPVSIPVKSDGGEELTLEVSSCPWSVEESSAPATKVVPLDGSYFSGDVHNSFGVMTYSVSSLVAPDPTLSWTDEAVYNGSIWTPSSSSRPWPSAGNYLKFFGWAPYVAVTPSDNSGEPVISEFEVEEIAANQVDLLVSKVVSKDSPPSSISVPLTFEHALTAVRFIGVRLTINSVTIRGIYDKGSYNMDTGEWSERSSLSPSQTYSSTSYVTDPSSTLMLIPQTLPEGATLTADTSAGIFTASLAGQEWDPGRVVTYKITDPVTSFSVSDTQKVRFSPGNLQAVFAAAGTSFTWKFADNQWDHVGNNAANTSINGNGSVSATGTVDLFGWSTSATRNGIHREGSSSYYSGDFVDWGDDSDLIDALGSGWRTLTYGEWDYLLNTRDNDDNESTLYPRYCLATVNSVPGLVIFPNEFFDLSIYYNINGVNTSGAAFTTNRWSGDAWTMMESVGCVFLPAAGRRKVSSITYDLTYGDYWSSTPYDAYLAYRLHFRSGNLYFSYETGRYFGLSVRLVQDL